ncbi:MAG: T9SS type A sorting domain-containing protein [Saprospiraceae bacterium]|nr:T9SS type A sorting domain-containing protein [Bacteroidia bacterium]NNE15032.1 T9SS type A sorting domain-containing protein [Saprospiraceae bacterium]NNL91340.1 T9SS type A sorting domain-containing protein [Saprospiraceae bacterium]
MKFKFIIVAFFLTSNCLLLSGQDFLKNHFLDTFDPIEYLNKVNYLNQPRKIVKNNNDFKIRYDSILFSDQSKIDVKVFYEFDNEKNHETEFYHYLRDDKFEPTAFFIFKFNQEDLLSEIIYADPWDGDTNVPGNNKINWIRRAEYDEDNKVKLYSRYLLTDGGEEFLTSQYDHIYNKRGHLSELHYYSYRNGDLKLSDIVYYNYENDLLVEIIDKIKLEDDSWVTEDSIVYKYYADDKLKTRTRYYGKEIGRNDNFNVELKYEYNDLDQLVGDHEYRNSEKENGGKSVIINKAYHTYDNLGNRILTEHFDSTNHNGLIITNEELYTYNLDYTSEETQLPKPNPFYYNEDINERSSIYPIKLYERYAYEQGYDRTLADKEEYFYSDIMTSNHSIPEEELTVSVYPNPTEDNLQLVFDNKISECDISIMDLSGTRVMDVRGFQSGDSIGVSNLPSGIYFYQVRSGDGVGSGRFLKF